VTEDTEWWTKVFVDGVDWSDSLISYDTHRIQYKIPGTDRSLQGPAGFAAFFRLNDETGRRDARRGTLHSLRIVVGDNHLQLPVRFFDTTADGQTLESTVIVATSVETSVPYWVPVEKGVRYVGVAGFIGFVPGDSAEGDGG
jgi:hypothetical protein